MSDPRPVLVVDLGAQYAQLIARRVRECRVYSEIVPHDLPVDELTARRPAGIVLSGGVDSSVAALLVHRAVGEQLTCVFVDTGLLRAGEAEQVEDTFARHFRVPLVHVKAADRFLARLGGVEDPERKRRIIGEEFIRVFEEAARPIGARFLVQGTLYPDVIESGSRT